MSYWRHHLHSTIWREFKSPRWRYLRVELVIDSRRFSERFSPGYSGFPRPHLIGYRFQIPKLWAELWIAHNLRLVVEEIACTFAFLPVICFGKIDNSSLPCECFNTLPTRSLKDQILSEGNSLFASFCNFVWYDLFILGLLLRKFHWPSRG